MRIEEIAARLKASVSLTRELKEMAHDLGKRDNSTEENVLRKLSVEALLESPDLSRREKLNKLRRIFRKERYPQLAAAEEKFNRAKNKLSLPESIHIHHSENFEKKEIKIEIKSRSKKELGEQVKKMNLILKQDEVKDLFL